MCMCVCNMCYEYRPTATHITYCICSMDTADVIVHVVTVAQILQSAHQDNAPTNTYQIVILKAISAQLISAYSTVVDFSFFSVSYRLDIYKLI